MAKKTEASLDEAQPDETVARYVVIDPLQHDGEDYAPGDTIDLNEPVATGLLESAVVMSAAPISPEPPVA